MYLLAALRMATKYQATHLTQRVLAKLAFWYPTTLAQWDAYHCLDSPADLSDDEDKDEALRHALSFGALASLREAGAPAAPLVPAAMLRCYVRWWAHHTELAFCARWAIDAADTRVVAAAMDIPVCLPHDLDAQACGGVMCTRTWAKFRWWLELQQDGGRCCLVEDVDKAEWNEFGVRACDRCLSAIKRAYQGGREAVWASLSALFYKL